MSKNSGFTFRYKPGSTFIHRIPSGINLIILMATGIILTVVPLYTIIPISLFTLLSFIIIRFPLHKMIRGHIFSLFMAALIVWGEWNNGEKEIITLIVKGGRFLGIYYAGILFAALTNPFDLGETIYRITKPFPFISSENLRLMVSVTLTFIPVLIDESRLINNACRSRLLFRSKNPIRKIRFQTEPLLTGVIRKSEDLATALASRCYAPPEK